MNFVDTFCKCIIFNFVLLEICITKVTFSKSSGGCPRTQYTTVWGVI